MQLFNFKVMISSKENSKPKEFSLIFNRIMYAAFVLLSLYFFVTKHDLGTAISNLGIALVFDPFDQKMMWSNRPLYQRVWLIAHVSLVIGLLGYIFMKWI